MLGTARLYVHPNRKNSGEKWLWSYFEPSSGLDPNNVALLYGKLNLPLDQYNVVHKSKFDNYDIHEKIAERNNHGYTLLPPFACDDLVTVKELIAAWQGILFRDDPASVPGARFDLVRAGLRALNGNVRLLHNADAPMPARTNGLRLLRSKKPAASRYNW